MHFSKVYELNKDTLFVRIIIIQFGLEIFLSYHDLPTTNLSIIKCLLNLKSLVTKIVYKSNFYFFIFIVRVL